MTASENTLASGKFFRFWSAANEPRAVVLISHGLGEHSGRYEHVAAALTADNLHVYALDHIGHGKSPGKPAYIDRFSDLTSGVSELRDHIRRHHAGLPVILIGHSMGGLIAIRLALGAHADYAGLVLTGPLLGQPEAPSRLQVMLLRVLSVLAPTIKAIEIDASAVSRDPAVVSDYIADPLVHHDNIPARTVVSLFDETAQVMNEASSLQLPVLITPRGRGQTDIGHSVGSIFREAGVGRTKRSQFMTACFMSFSTSRSKTAFCRPVQSG
jgi:alpha-beta hydrolase superfamily lysophospholipase